MTMLRTLIAVALLAGASLATWTLLAPDDARPAVPTAPGTELGLHVRWEGEQPWLCATVQVDRGPSAHITRTQARARGRALLAQACQDAERRLVDSLREGPDALPGLADPWAALPEGVVALTLSGLRSFDAPSDLSSGRSTQGLPWALVVAGASQALEGVPLQDPRAVQDLLEQRARAAAHDPEVLQALWVGTAP